MSETVTQQETEVKKERKPRTTYTAIRCVFKLSEAYLLIFRELLKTIESGFSDDLPFEFHMDKLVLRVMDAGRYKMVNIILPRSAFEEWHVGEDGRHRLPEFPVRIKLSIADLIYVIKDASKRAVGIFEVTALFGTSKKTLRVDVRKPMTCPKCGLSTNYNGLPTEKQVKNRYKCTKCGWRGKVRKWQKNTRVGETEVSEKSKLTVTIKDDTEERHSLKLINENVEAIPCPTIHFEAKFKLVAQTFKSKLEKLAQKTDKAKVQGSKDEVVLSGENDTIDSAITIRKGSDILIDADAPSTPEIVTFSLDHMTAILPEKVAEVIGVDYSTDAPIRVTWHTQLHEATVEYYLAPRIETD